MFVARSHVATMFKTGRNRDHINAKVDSEPECFCVWPSAM